MPPAAPAESHAVAIKRYARDELLRVAIAPGRTPSGGMRWPPPKGMPPFKSWFGDVPPQTSPIQNKRSPRAPHSHLAGSGGTSALDAGASPRRTNRRATSPTSFNRETFPRERAPHREGAAAERGSSDFRNPFAASSGAAGVMGSFRHNGRDRGDADGSLERGERLGLKKLSETYDRIKTNGGGALASATASAAVAAGLRTGPTTSSTREGGLGSGTVSDRDRDQQRGDRRETRTERAERIERERAERKAERSEDWRRGTSALPSRPNVSSASTSSSLATSSTRVPGRPAWNPAPEIGGGGESGGISSSNNRRRGGAADRDDDDSAEPAWMGEWEPGSRPGSGIGGGRVEKRDGEDEIQRFKREMKEREDRSRRATERLEGGSGKDLPVAAAAPSLPTSLSIGSFNIPVTPSSSSTPASSSGVASPAPATSASASGVSTPPASLPPPTHIRDASASSAAPPPGLLSMPLALPSPAISTASTTAASSLPGEQPSSEGAPSAAGGRRGGSRFAKFFVDGKQQQQQTGSSSSSSVGGMSPQPQGLQPVGGVGALFSGAGAGGDGSSTAAGGGAPDSQMNKLLAMLQSSKPGDVSSPLQAHVSPGPMHAFPPSLARGGAGPATSPAQLLDAFIRPSPLLTQTSPSPLAASSYGGPPPPNAYLQRQQQQAPPSRGYFSPPPQNQLPGGPPGGPPPPPGNKQAHEMQQRQAQQLQMLIEAEHLRRGGPAPHSGGLAPSAQAYDQLRQMQQMSLGGGAGGASSPPPRMQQLGYPPPPPQLNGGGYGYPPPLPNLQHQRQLPPHLAPPPPQSSSSSASVAPSPGGPPPQPNAAEIQNHLLRQMIVAQQANPNSRPGAPSAYGGRGQYEAAYSMGPPLPPGAGPQPPQMGGYYGGPPPPPQGPPPPQQGGPSGPGAGDLLSMLMGGFPRGSPPV